MEKGASINLPASQNLLSDTVSVLKIKIKPNCFCKDGIMKPMDCFQGDSNLSCEKARSDAQILD